MRNRSLRETNPYLRNPERRREMFTVTVCTSTAVEGVRLTPADLEPNAPTAPRPAVTRGARSSGRSRP